MKIAMFTNTYPPHVGGVARSVSTQVEWLQAHGHETLVIAPEFPDIPEGEEPGVLRVPAIQNFNGSDFSVRLPLGLDAVNRIEAFAPDIVHSHHPFLMGDSALRIAYQEGRPLIFTHHTRYEDYAHYILEDSDALKALAREIALNYSSLADLVVAPSASIEQMLLERELKQPIRVIPTGIDPERFRPAEPQAVRERLGIPADAFTLGHVGRLAPEKNLPYLMEAVTAFLRKNESCHFLVVGYGPEEEKMRASAEKAGIGPRCHFAGKLEGQDLADAYHALDLFVFSSKSETQGMVLAEAMTCGKPVVALDAPGAREVVRDGSNGRLLAGDASPEQFAEAADELYQRLRNGSPEDRNALEASLRETAEAFSLDACMGRMCELYAEAIADYGSAGTLSGWEKFLGRCEAEWRLALEKAASAGAAIWS
ncbi:glycosyltransferase [Ruficoccus amylovorans]|uniref:Glycosyltransferase n=1 Tax=Ruficoccus amylovorans TaxID=1804625 RepID=A0A842HE20_9BACT|nr:glycosyltransferase [Ruficoccus amylovorans]MBC2593591.1 glycosyltransferase [Ruficoccus amylovorans]